MNFAQRLQQACARRDWAAIKRLDKELAVQASAWIGDDTPWSPHEQQALDALKQVHAGVAAQCVGELRSLGRVLTRIGSQQLRWQAYAQSLTWGNGR